MIGAFCLICVCVKEKLSEIVDKLGSTSKKLQTLPGLGVPDDVAMNLYIQNGR